MSAVVIRGHPRVDQPCPLCAHKRIWTIWRLLSNFTLQSRHQSAIAATSALTAKADMLIARRALDAFYGSQGEIRTLRRTL
jgi:hypothetical protein